MVLALLLSVSIGSELVSLWNVSYVVGQRQTVCLPLRVSSSSVITTSAFTPFHPTSSLLGPPRRKLPENCPLQSLRFSPSLNLYPTCRFEIWQASNEPDTVCNRGMLRQSWYWRNVEARYVKVRDGRVKRGSRQELQEMLSSDWRFSPHTQRILKVL